MTSFLPLELNDIGFMPKRKRVFCVPGMFQPCSLNPANYSLEKKIITLALWPVNI